MRGMEVKEEVGNREAGLHLINKTNKGGVGDGGCLKNKDKRRSTWAL
jgi:hypothetical protein